MSISLQLNNSKDNNIVTANELQFFLMLNFQLGGNNLQDLDGLEVYSDPFPGLESNPEFCFFAYTETKNHPLMPMSQQVTYIGVEYEGKQYQELPIDVFNYLCYCLAQNDELCYSSIDEVREFLKYYGG